MLLIDGFITKLNLHLFDRFQYIVFTLAIMVMELTIGFLTVHFRHDVRVIFPYIYI